MTQSKTMLIALSLWGLCTTSINAQTTEEGNNFTAHPIPDRTVSFNISDAGVPKPIIWGLDLAWLSEDNIRRGIAFMGAERIGIIRSSFTPTSPLIDGELPANELATLKKRLNAIKLVGSNMNIALNSDHPSVDPWFVGNASNWAQLIDVTTRLHEEAGHTVVTVSPFNEPDYSYTGQGTMVDFFKIAGELKQNPRFDNIRISGGNTLNCDQALPWYTFLKSRLDEGNTHQLAGSFDNYAKFYETVRTNGHHATNDELHNVMEAMVGVEYGMQTGIWWGTAEFARGEFVKASDGERLGYAEHRPNWSAASVYRAPDGKIQAFGGTSERQAVTTTYRFVSKDRDVFYDGYGPQREYTMVMPGGTGYQEGQANAERVVNITWGDDIQPVINGRYVLVNRNSGKVIEVINGEGAGANVRQSTYYNRSYQQWDVTPVDSRIGGDFSYFTFLAAHNGKSLDILNWSLNNGGNIVIWDDSKGTNQQWYLEYAEDGWFYIRSRHSAKCLEVANSSNLQGANIQQRDKNGGANQQWRFLPVGAAIEFNSPDAPKELTATANATSIRLNWTANTESDVAGYTIFRSESAGGSYNTIARDVKSTSFIDNTAHIGKQYYYTIKAIDNSLNRSAYSNEVTATATGEKELVAYLNFEESLRDKTINLNHASSSGNIAYNDGKIGRSIRLNGKDAFVQLPAYVASHEEISVAMWIYWRGTTNRQRIFDFGNDESEYMFLTPSADSGKLRFTMKSDGLEQTLEGPKLSKLKWTHITITLGKSGTRMYVDGELAAESNDFTINPNNFKPILNYIGRSQFANDPLFNGNIDDFRIYNYPLSAEEITDIAIDFPNEIVEINATGEDNLLLWPLPANDVLYANYSSSKNTTSSTLSLYSIDGRLVMSKDIKSSQNCELNVSTLPAGMYMIKLANQYEVLTKKIIIKH